MRAVVFSVLILSALLFIILVVFFALHDSSVDARSGLKRKLNATCIHENYTAIRKNQDPFANNGTAMKLGPCNDDDPSQDCSSNLPAENATNIRPKRTPGEKAEEMCKRYGKTAYRNVSNPFNIGPKHIAIADCDTKEPLIKAGAEEAYEKEFPHMVLIGNFVEDVGFLHWICSGSLVSPEYVIGAAHCPISLENGFVMYGSNKVENTNDFFDQHVISISEVHIHPDYNPKTNENDLALYRLATELDTSERPICLGTGSSLTNDMRVISTGYSIRKEEKDTFVLQKMQSRIVDQGTCAVKYKKIRKDVPKFSVCADYKCQFYVEGPIQIRNSLECMYTLIGIPSFGANCRLETSLPDVYTEVSPYIEWIEDIVWPV